MSPGDGPPAGASGERPSARRERPAFATVLCGVDGSETANEAVRQAALLGGPGARITLLGVAYEAGAGLTERALLSPQRAREAVRRARPEAAPPGAEIAEVVVASSDVASMLLSEAKAHELVAVGARGRAEPRAAGIALATVPAVLTHRAPGPVLLARRPPEDARFPARILLASDESEGAQEAARIAAAIARGHDSRVTVLHVGPGGSHRILAEETTELFETTGTEPTVVIEDGNAAARIVELAARDQSSLIVVGSRGLGGVKALGSVSERVAHRAPCSVLVVRPRVDPERAQPTDRQRLRSP